MTVKERHYWKFIKQILFLLNYILFIIKICQMCKIKSHWMFSVVFFMFYICVICDCLCPEIRHLPHSAQTVLIWPRQFSFGPCFFNLAHTLARTKNEPEGTLLEYEDVLYFDRQPHSIACILGTVVMEWKQTLQGSYIWKMNTFWWLTDMI